MKTKQSENDWRDIYVAMCSCCRHGNSCILEGTGYWFAPNAFTTRTHEFNAYRNSPLICYKYEPSLYCKWVLEKWTNVFDYMKYQIDCGYIRHNCYVSLIKGENRSVNYHVRYSDFFHNEFINEDGTLQAYEKIYYKRTRKSVTGYELVHEWLGEDKNKQYIFNI